MQYKIEGSLQQIQDLKTHVFDEYLTEIKNKQLQINTEDDYTFTFFSMVRAFLKRPVSVDYMTRDLVKFVVL